MVALTADKEVEFDLNSIRSHPVAATTEIFLGALVCVNAAGNAVPAADTAGLIFVGVATEHADNNPGAAGDIRVKVRVNGMHRMVAAGLTLADVGEKVFTTDDQLVALSTTNSIHVGRITQFDTATSAMVNIEGAAARGAVTQIALTDIAAFTDPPNAAEMALLRTFVNTLKAAINA